MLGILFSDEVTGPNATHVLHAAHHPNLMLLSIVAAWVGIGCAYFMANASNANASPRHRKVSLRLASIVLGLGIWETHFIGMLAVEFPFEVRYDGWLTMLSILPGILAAWMALRLLYASSTVQVQQLLGCATLITVGIAAMHYTGLAAVHAPGSLHFAGTYVLGSLCVGWLLAFAAFASHRWIVQHHQSATWPWWYKLLPVSLLTGAVLSMHYVSMHGMRLGMPLPESTPLPGYLVSRVAMSWLLVFASMWVFLLLGLCVSLLRYRDLWQEVALRDARLNAMIDTAADGVIVINDRGIVTDYNLAASHIFGYTKAEVVGNNLSMLMPSPLAEQHDSHLVPHQKDPHLALKAPGREVLGKHKEGRHVPLQIAIGKSQTPAGPIFVGFLQDISSRKRTDAQLRIAASVFQHVREGVAIVDAYHNISDVNPAFLRLMDQTREQCMGRSLESLYEDADLPLDMPKLWSAVTQQQYWQGEVSFTRSNGLVWVQRLSISPVLNEQQRPHHYIAVVSDVSERPGLEVLLPHEELHDSQSGLPTEKLFFDRLTNSLGSARRKSLCVGVLLFEIKPPAAPSSHAGTLDIVSTVRLMQQLLRAQLRSTDTLARIQPNQLALLMPGAPDEATLHALSRRLVYGLYDLSALRGKLEAAELYMALSCSPAHGLSAVELVEAAQNALLPLPAKSSALS